MVDKKICFLFPELHSALTERGRLPESCRHVWPGLPELPDMKDYVSPNYPFTPEEAAGCLKDMQAMESAALSGVPVRAVAALHGDARERKEEEEKAELAAFAGGKEQPSGKSALPEIQARRRAQKILIWAWLLEERLIELRELTGVCAAGIRGLTGGLDADMEEGALSPVAELQNALQQADDGILPRWEVLLEQLAWFLPEDGTLLVSRRVAGDMRERISFTPAAEELCRTFGLAEGEFLSAAAPLWQLLGGNRPKDPRQHKRLRIITQKEPA